MEYVLFSYIRQCLVYVASIVVINVQSVSMLSSGMYCYLPVKMLSCWHLSINVPSIAKLVACFYKCSPIFFAIIHSSQFVLSYGFTPCF